MPFPRQFRKVSLAPLCLASALLVATPQSMAADSGSVEPPSSSDSAAADDDQDRTYSEHFTGAFVEYSVRGGASFASNAAYDGWHIDAGVRHSFPMLLGDLRLAYRFDNLDDSGRLTPGPLEQHSVGGYLALHPAYLLMLGSDWLSYTLASLHFELGGGARLSVLERSNEDVFETGFGPFFSIGGGVDIPLADPDAGSAPWLNVVYRWQISDFDDAVETYDLDMHILQVGVGWRINGLMF